MNCQACLTPLPEVNIEQVEKEVILVRCTHCLCTNKVKGVGDGKVTITLTYNPTYIDHRQKKQLVNISQDIRLYIDVLKSLGYTYTDLINEGLALHIQQLPEHIKRKVSSLIQVIKHDDDENE